MDPEARRRLRICDRVRRGAGGLLVARHVPLVVTLVALLAFTGIGLTLPMGPAGALAPAAPPRQNDASSGQDAGDSPEIALVLANARRPWNANLTPPGSDADWYRLDTSEAFCAVADATTTAEGQLTLTSTASRDAAAGRLAPAHKATHLVLAAPAGHAALLGLEPASMFMRTEDGGARPSPGHYTFTLSTSTISELDPTADGEVPEAGDTPATAVAFPSECSAGRLQSAAGDLEDHYSFDVTDPRALTLSFAVASGDAAEVRVKTPTGATYATLASGDAVDVWASQPGRWTIAVAYPTPTIGPSPLQSRVAPPLLPAPLDTLDTSYILGLTDGPGDPQQCRPSCVG